MSYGPPRAGAGYGARRSESQRADPGLRRQRDESGWRKGAKMCANLTPQERVALVAVLLIRGQFQSTWSESANK